jgi:adenosyl cobinamide kinase/adenosyl cobinamide phosphate guanylyltransferase
MAMTLLIGGARAGKSTLAVRRAVESGLPVTFIATAEALDDEMAERIAGHRAGRPAEWATVEEPRDLARSLKDVPPGDAVIVDCLTLWISNLLLDELDHEEITARAEEAAELAAQREGPTFVVTNEVGSGVVPDSELGRRFRDLLGRVNSIWSEEAADALLVLAGRATPLERW